MMEVSLGNWNFDMDAAPKGSYKTVKSGKGESEVFTPEWCIIAVEPNNSVLRSYWIPESNRWNGTTKESNTVIAWQMWPEYPVNQ